MPKTKDLKSYKKKKSNKPTNQEPVKKDFISIMDTFFDKNKDKILYISLLLTVVLGIYLFDVKISEGGDDSSYIVSAKKFLEGVNFPTWHGSFYPIFLSLPMLIFGVNLIVFKIISFLLIVGHLVFFYLAFKNRISSTLLSLVVIITAVNSYLLYFASQTYSEALFLFLQSIVIFVFFHLMDTVEEGKMKGFRPLGWWLSFGVLSLLLGTTRNIGYGMLIAIIIFFLIDRKYRAALYSVLSFLIFAIPYNLYKWIVWGFGPGGGNSGRINEIFYKDPYNAAAGTEDFAGMITRFIENSKIYLSKHFFVITGFKNEMTAGTSGFLTIIMYVLFIVVLIYAFRKSKVMRFVGMYLGIAIFITFITLQQKWGQLRLILVFTPLILLYFSWGIYQLSKKKHWGILQFLLVLFLMIIMFHTFGISVKKAKSNSKVLARNIHGNLYYGFTPDWVNFLKMSEWASENLPKNAVVASRKSSMSFVYGKGKEFYSIYRFPVENPDTVILRLKEQNKDFCIVDPRLLVSNTISDNLKLYFMVQNVAFVNDGKIVYGIYDLNSNDPTFRQSLHNDGLNCNMSLDSLKKTVDLGGLSSYAVVPDTLINILKKGGVDYIIRASLRINPAMKTDRTINTILRYMYFIEQKYPGIFTLVQQIGDNNDEPAYLYKINYDRIDLYKKMLKKQ